MHVFFVLFSHAPKNSAMTHEIIRKKKAMDPGNTTIKTFLPAK